MRRRRDKLNTQDFLYTVMRGIRNGEMAKSFAFPPAPIPAHSLSLTSPVLPPDISLGTALPLHKNHHHPSKSFLLPRHVPMLLTVDWLNSLPAASSSA